MQEAAIKTKVLGRSFGSLWAVRELDLLVKPGEIFGLVGPDGAGKTTAMRMLAGVLIPSEGEAWVEGLPVVSEAEVIKKRIGYMPQKFGLYGDLSVEENLRFYGDLYEIPRKTRSSLEEKLLAFSNLTPFRGRLARDLSGGMKQKLGLACALVHRPSVLLLDEPTNGVDPVSRRDFWKILYEMVKEGVTVFVSTAYLDEAERCGRVGFMDHGRLILCDTPRNLKAPLTRSIMEVAAEEPRKALHLLHSLYGKTRADLVSEKIRLRLPQGITFEKVQENLEAEGILIKEIRFARPTLEDVFVNSPVVLPRKVEESL
jgi:ABC-2 type transport system ATP-binding protein